METTQIREETDILSRLIRLRKIDGITNEEYQKMLSTISDETVLVIVKVGFYSKEAAEILQERMRKWSESRLIYTVNDLDQKLSKPVYEVLVEKMTKWSGAKLRKAMQDGDPTIARAALKADELRKEIDDLRKKLGLNPL